MALSSSIQAGSCSRVAGGAVSEGPRTWPQRDVRSKREMAVLNHSSWHLLVGLIHSTCFFNGPKQLGDVMCLCFLTWADKSIVPATNYSNSKRWFSCKQVVKAPGQVYIVKVAASESLRTFLTCHSNKKLRTKGIATRSKKLLVAPGITTSNKKLLGWRPSHSKKLLVTRCNKGITTRNNV